MNTIEKRCSTCVISSSFPKIDFDERGVCSFCRDKLFSIAENQSMENATRKIGTLIKDNKGKSEYDAVMCYSGGKDSTYTLMLAVKKYGLKVLSFTLDNGFISPVAFENIYRVVDFLGVDQITIRPSSKFLIPLIKVSALYDIYHPKTLTRISSVCNSCISLVNITALKLAIEKDVPFILAGFTLGQIPLNAVTFKNNYKFLQESRKPYLEKLRNYLGKAVDAYYTIDSSVLDKIKSYPYNINLLCLEHIKEDEIIKKILPTGWRAPEDVDGCSSNCQLNVFNNYIHQKKFGYNPYELELSHLIRNGQLTREMALEKINNQPNEYLKSIMARLGIEKLDIDNLSDLHEL